MVIPQIIHRFFNLAPSLITTALIGTLAGCDGTEQSIELDAPSGISVQLSSTPLASDSIQISSVLATSSLRPIASDGAHSATVMVSSQASTGISSASGSYIYSSSSHSALNNNISNSSSFGAVQSSTPSSMASMTYIPETPVRIPFDYTLTANWDTQYIHFNIDDFAANTETGMGYAIDTNMSVIFALNLLTGDIAKIGSLSGNPTSMAYLQSQGLIAVAVGMSPRLLILNEADFSLADTVALNATPADVAMSEGGILVVSFANGDPLFVYDMVAASILPSPVTPNDSQFSFVGETLVVTSATHPSDLWRYDISSGVVTDLGVLNFDGLNLGAIIGNANTADVIVTDTGLLLDKNTFVLVDAIDYGQSKFKRVEFLRNSDYALSVDDQNYLRLFDARSHALDYGVADDTRRIGSNSSLQSQTISALAVYRDSALAIYPSYGDSNRYSITQLQLPPYLASERLIAGGQSESPSSTASSEWVSSSVGANSSGQVLASSSLASSSSMYSYASSSVSAYPYVVLDIHSGYGNNPQDIRVDQAAGIIYVPLVELTKSWGAITRRIQAIDLTTGKELYDKSVNFTTNAPTLDWAANADLTEFCYKTAYADNDTEFYCIDRTQQNALTGFDIAMATSDMFVTEDYILALGANNSGLYQYDKTTGELLGSIETEALDDWLVLPNSKIIYTLKDRKVKQYGFTGALYETDLNITTEVPDSAFGFASPDESTLYLPRRPLSDVVDLNDFSIIERVYPKADARRTFVDISFGSARNFTLETYISDEGQAFNSQLRDHLVTPYDVTGLRIFQSAAGVHVYSFHNGEHRIYTLVSAGKGSFPY